MPPAPFTEAGGRLPAASGRRAGYVTHKAPALATSHTKLALDGAVGRVCGGTTKKEQVSLRNMAMPFSYGAVPRRPGGSRGNGHRLLVGVVGLGVVAVLAGTVSLRALSRAPVELAQEGGLMQEIASEFSDTAQRAPSAVRPAARLPVMRNQATTMIGKGYDDGMTGARLDRVRLVPGQEKRVANKEKHLRRSGVEVDHWPWDSPADGSGEYPREAKSRTTRLRQKQDSIVKDLMSAFADSPHRNPMLSKAKLQKLRAKSESAHAKKRAGAEKQAAYARKAEERPQASARRGIPQMELERLARRQQQERLAMRESSMLAHTPRFGGGQAGIRQSAAGARPHRQQLASPLQQLDGEVEASSDEAGSAANASTWGVNVRWDGHNDRCSSDTPNCNTLGKRGAGGGGVHVYGWPWDEKAQAEMKQKQLAMALQGDAAQLLHLTSAHQVNADVEERLAQALEGQSFDMLKLAELQQLDADDVSNGTQVKPRWGMFPKWYWTHDSTEYLEKEHGVPVDQWPWEDCHGIDCKHAARARRWGLAEVEEGEKLQEDGADMAQLAAADAQRGLFPTLEALAGDEAGGSGNVTAVPCSPDAPNCHKLEGMGVKIGGWPWQEARAKREWEVRLAREVTDDADALYYHAHEPHV